MIVIISPTDSLRNTESFAAKNKWITLGIVCAGNLMVSITASSVNLANPTLASAFSVDINQIQWVTTIFVLVTSSLMLLMGRIGDRVGSHKLYISGFVIFITGSLLCGMSGGFSTLLAARVVKAFGASMISATGMGIIVTAFPENQCGKAIGIQAVAIGVGYVCGPSVGGFILESFSWHYIFYSNIPVAIIGLLGAIKYLRSPMPEDKSKQLRLDGLGALLFAVMICSLIISLSGGIPASAWFLLVIALVLPCFILHERRHPSPLWDLNLLKNKRFALGSLIVFLIYTTHFCAIFQMPIYMTNVLGMSVRTIGIVAIGSPAMMAVTATISGFISDKVGPLRMMPLAILIFLSSQISFALLRSDSSLWHVLLGMSLLGIGVGALETPANSVIMTSAGVENAGYAGGFLSTTRNLSLCIGTAASAGAFTFLRDFFESSLGAAASMSAFRIVFITASAITCVSFGICLWMIRFKKQPSGVAEE